MVKIAVIGSCSIDLTVEAGNGLQPANNNRQQAHSFTGRQRR